MIELKSTPEITLRGDSKIESQIEKLSRGESKRDK